MTGEDTEGQQDCLAQCKRGRVELNPDAGLQSLDFIHYTVVFSLELKNAILVSVWVVKRPLGCSIYLGRTWEIKIREHCPGSPGKRGSQ